MVRRNDLVNIKRRIRVASVNVKVAKVTIISVRGRVKNTPGGRLINLSKVGEMRDLAIYELVSI